MLFLLDERDEEQQQARADDADNDLPDDAATRVDTQQVHHKAADKAANDTDNDVPEQPETTTTHNVAGQPAYHGT